MISTRRFSARPADVPGVPVTRRARHRSCLGRIAPDGVYPAVTTGATIRGSSSRITLASGPAHARCTARDVAAARYVLATKRFRMTSRAAPAAIPAVATAPSVSGGLGHCTVSVDRVHALGTTAPVADDECVTAATAVGAVTKQQASVTTVARRSCAVGCCTAAISNQPVAGTEDRPRTKGSAMN